MGQLGVLLQPTKNPIKELEMKEARSIYEDYAWRHDLRMPQFPSIKYISRLGQISNEEEEDPEEEEDLEEEEYPNEGKDVDSRPTSD
ncbi:hypothetical protein PVK06_047509 [Gossypium arboreum]|uniref:Uncharacterized protein n=1 Tax=Gossypium arboreum TaxID=29729 RepID=A0ABR0MDK5_GOSAR|nr:hypothetical protein PVK06_047509 [Gossypium arboreum]